MLLQDIFSDCGLQISRYESVNGGDISQAYCLYAHNERLFLKINNATEYPQLFEKEANALQALNENSAIKVPAVIKTGEVEHQQYLLLEWLEKGSPAADCWKNFGAGLAQQHKQKGPYFGWQENNFIGSLPQLNNQKSSWHLFYAECRILPLVRQLFDRGFFSGKDRAAAERFCGQLEALFPAEPPALLHGDLWSGNYLVTQTGYAGIFDPAVYYGHREMDIGMSRLFGGFHNDFYMSYQEISPLEAGWQQRLPLTQLYPLLVHAVLFGAHYVADAREILQPFAG